MNYIKHREGISFESMQEMTMIPDVKKGTDREQWLRAEYLSFFDDNPIERKGEYTETSTEIERKRKKAEKAAIDALQCEFFEESQLSAREGRLDG